MVLAWAAEHGTPLALDAESRALDPAADDWIVAGIDYARGRRPFLADVKRAGGRFAPLFQQEVEEFVEQVEALPPSRARDRVLNHLARTRYLVSLEFLSDMDDHTLAAASVFLDYFAAHHDGLVQADGEGFWVDGVLLLPLS